MTKLDAAAAVEKVRDEANVEPALDLEASQLPEFPEFWYVTAHQGGRPLIGGEAFVVDQMTGQVVEVPGSRPPRVNCEWVRQRRGG